MMKALEEIFATIGQMAMAAIITCLIFGAVEFLIRLGKLALDILYLIATFQVTL